MVESTIVEGLLSITREIRPERKRQSIDFATITALDCYTTTFQKSKCMLSRYAMRWRNSDEMTKNPAILQTKMKVLMVTSMSHKRVAAFERNRQ